MAVFANLDPEDVGTYHAVEGLFTPVPGSNEQVDSYTVPVGKMFRLSELVISSFHPGVFQVIIDGTTVIRRGRVNAAAVTVPIPFSPKRDVLEGEEVTIHFDARGGQDASDFEYSLAGTLIDC